MTIKHSSQRGQAIILIAGALVALLGAVALAIDGSMVYADRRKVQSAADNAVMSAAAEAAMALDQRSVNYQTFICGQPYVTESMIVARDATIARAAAAGYEVDADISDGNGVEISCHVDDNAALVDTYFDIRIMITSPTDTAFTRFVPPSGINNTVEAVSRVRPRRSLAQGNAIASLGTECGGVDIGCRCNFLPFRARSVHHPQAFHGRQPALDRAESTDISIVGTFQQDGVGCLAAGQIV